MSAKLIANSRYRPHSWDVKFIALTLIILLSERAIGAPLTKALGMVIVLLKIFSKISRGSNFFGGKRKEILTVEYSILRTF